MNTPERLPGGLTWWTLPDGRRVLELPPVDPETGLALELELLAGERATIWTWRTERGRLLAVIPGGVV